jgi:hypothetical protein
MKTLILITTMMLLSINLYSSPPDSCLKMIWSNDYDNLTQTGAYNPDSVKVDSCLGSQTFGKHFAKRYFYMQFYKNYYPFDNVLKPDSIKSVEDISNSKPALKLIFQQLETQFGAIYFQGLINDYPDTIVLQNPRVRLYFSEYQDIQLVIASINAQVDTLKAIYYENREINPVSVEELTDNQDGKVLIFPSPVKNILNLKFLTSDVTQIISIYSLQGQKVYETEYKEQINVSSLQPGIYFLKYKNKNYKFIREN